MMKKIHVLTLMTLLSCSESLLAVVNSSVNLDIDAKSVSRVAIYYRERPVTGSSIDFPLPIDGISQRFERVSDLLYLVGNVPQAEIVFVDPAFVLNSLSGRREKINLSGYFIHNGISSDSRIPREVPVLKNISEATVATGFKVHFRSEYSSGFYTQDSYANTFTLLVTPKI